MESARNDNLRVFLSSTFSDLKEYRAAAINTLRRFGFVPLTFEDMGTLGEAPATASARALAEADIVVFLVAHRYGYIEPESEKSIIELEYEEAVAKNKPVLVFLVSGDQPWLPDQIDLQDRHRLQAFKQRLKEDRMVDFFKTPEDLSVRLATAISHYSRQIEAIPPELSEATKPRKVTLVDVLDELKLMRTEVSTLQQVIAGDRREYSGQSVGVQEHAMIRPADFLGVPSKSTDPQKCFVIMPYSEGWSQAVERTILEVCQKLDFKFSIAKNMEGRFIPNDIWRGITGAGLIIADLSGANPNVTYEIGLADVLGREVVLICQSGDVPFDFLGQRLIIYENTVAGALTLREGLTSRLNEFKAEAGEKTSQESGQQANEADSHLRRPQLIGKTLGGAFGGAGIVGIGNGTKAQARRILVVSSGLAIVHATCPATHPPRPKRTTYLAYGR